MRPVLPSRSLSDPSEFYLELSQHLYQVAPEHPAFKGGRGIANGYGTWDGNG